MIPKDTFEAQQRLQNARLVVDAAASRHAQCVAGAIGEVTSTANTIAKTAVFGILLGARYVAGFATGLVRGDSVPNA